MTSLAHIPGPRGVEFIRSMLHFLDDSLGALEAATARYGPIVSYPWPVNTVIVYEPSAIAHVLADPDSIYVKGAQTDEMQAVLGQGLVTNNDRASWARRRQLVTHVMSANAVRGFTPTFAARTDAMLDRWPAQGEREVTGELRALAFDIAARTLFGVDLSDADARTVDDAVLFTSLVVHHHMFRLVPVPYWLPTAEHRAFHRHLRGLDAVVQRLVARAQQGADDGSVLTRLAQARDDAGEPLDARALRDEILTLLVAGYETTANTLAWVLGLLAAHPDWQAKLHTELDVAGAAPSVDARKTHPLLALTVHEAIRLYTAIPMSSRRATREDVLLGHHIPAGTSVVLPVWVLHRANHHWGNALQFDPLRFEGQKPHHLAQYVPFSKGERSCVGQTFALTEVAAIVARVLARYRLTLRDGELPRAVSQVSLKPDGGLTLRVEARRA